MHITLDPPSPRDRSKVLDKPLSRVLNLVTYYKGELRPVVELRFYRTAKTHYVRIAVWYSHDPSIEHRVGEGIAQTQQYAFDQALESAGIQVDWYSSRHDLLKELVKVLGYDGPTIIV